MDLIEQLAEYKNAPIDSLEAAKQGANPNISPWVAGAILSDRIEKQKRMALQQGAAQGQQPTVSDKQDQEVAGIMQALASQGAPQEQGAQQGAAPMQEPVMAAEGGLMQASVDPRMFDYSGGGIIAFDKGGDVEDDTIYDPVTGVAIAGASTRTGDDMTLREALGLGNVENRRALEAVDQGQRDAEKAKVAKAEKDQQTEADRILTEYAVAPPPAKAPPRAAPAGGAKPAASKGVLALLTDSPEWKAMEAARTKEFEAPDMPTTAGGLAAEKAAHLKAQGITEMPWEQAAKQTAELRRMTKADDEARAAKLEADKGRPTFHRLIANMGPGSFAQSSAQSLRKQVEYEDAMAAETQRIKDKRYDQNLKLNEIDAKAQELRYNEAVGDVAAAQKNRQDLATLKRQYQKDSAALAKEQAGLRERAAAVDATNATTLAAARERSGASGVLTPFQLAKVRDMAADNVKDTIRAGGIPMQMALQKDPGLRDRMVEKETKRILASYGVEGAQEPVQSQYGPPPKGAVREVKR